MPTPKVIDSTTQKFLDIYDITNDLVILKDGTSSLIITVDAMNFGLLAEEEQDSIMYAYAGLLNSLNYPIQIIVKSQTKDVTGYLRLLKEQEDKIVNNVQRQRIMKYREFVSNLIRERNVLDKKFYVTIPAKPLELGLVPVSSVIPGQAQTDVSSIEKTVIIEKAKSILEPKRDHLIAQFARIGLYSRQLETQEIIQMFYQSYNPEAFEGQHMGDSKTYTTPLVLASIEENTMDNTNNPNQPAASAATPTPSNTTAPTATPTAYTAPTPVSANEPTPPNTVVEPITTTNPAPSSDNTLSEAEQPPKTNSSVLPTPETNTLQDQSAENTGYTPKIINNQNLNPMSTPAIPDTQAAESPTPPAPELPKNDGEVDKNVPQEVEIEIKHPGEKAAEGVSTDQTTTIPTPMSPMAANSNENQSTPTVNQPSNAGMPPLPEIK